jgi:hypothetical protein
MELNAAVCRAYGRCLPRDVRRAVGEDGQFLRCREIVDPVCEPAGRGAVASGGDSGKQEPTRNGTLPSRAGGGHSSKGAGRDGRAVPYRSERLYAGRSLWSSWSRGSGRPRSSSKAARPSVPFQRPLRLGADVNGLDRAVLDVLRRDDDRRRRRRGAGDHGGNDRRDKCALYVAPLSSDCCLWPQTVGIMRDPVPL